MTWHLYGSLGMMPFGIPTDPALPEFLNRAKAEIPALEIHGPYRDYQAGQVAAEITRLPPTDGVFVVGTSLSANDGPVVASYTHHKIDGLFGFQASEYGVHQPVPANVKFAYLFSSDVPFPWPGIGAYRWVRGAGMTGGLVLHTHDIPHPGDYDIGDQDRFIACMKHIIAASEATP